MDASKKLFWHPNPAKDGRPILIWRSQYHYPLPSSAAATTSSNTTTSSLICSPSSSDRDSNYEVNLHIQWIAHTLETAKRDGVIKDKIHFILDRSETQQASATTTTSSFLSFATSSTSQSSNDLSLSRAIITTFASHYPEHLERVFVFPSSMMVSALWTLIKPFMDPVTQMRVMILGEKEVKAALDWFVGKDQLLVEYGGGFVDEDVKRFEIAGKEQDDVEKPESKPHHHHRRHHQHHRKKHPQTTNHSAIKYLDRTQPAVSNAPGRVPVDQIAATDSIAALAAEVASFQV